MMPMSPTETHGALFLLRTLTEVWGGVNVGFTAMLLWGLHDLQRGWTQARLTAGPSTAATQTPPIAILRPCEGDEPGLASKGLLGLYVVALVFTRPFSPLRVEGVLRRALPIIERNVTELPPLDPEPMEGRVVPMRS